ncbi:MAG: glycosyltransferase family 2 protein [Eubacterium sp.]
MQKNKISVIVPIYKTEKYLDKCIESIVNQTYENLEIILVDDGSPDGCPRKCDEWAERDSRIKVIHKENGGISSARNAGLDNATGDFIGFVDGDDFIENDFYEILINNLIENDADISFCSFKYYNDGSTSYSTGVEYQNNLTVLNSKALLSDFFSSCKGELVSLCNKVIKRSLFEGLRFPQGRIFEDWTLSPMLYSKCEKAVFMPAHKYCYIIHQGSAVRTQTVKRYCDCVSADYDHYCFFNNLQISDYNGQISSFARSDFLKCIKYYTPSAKNKKLLKQAYEKCRKMSNSKIIKIMYAFPFLFHIIALIREKLK